LIEQARGRGLLIALDHQRAFFPRFRQ
jgi:hypothetical protein